METSVTYKNGAFYARNLEGSFTEKELKKFGWKHNNRDGWLTTNIMSAHRLREHADERVKNIINKAFIQHSPFTGALLVPEGLLLLPHQPGSVRYALSRNRSYLALSPGLGKTPIAALIASCMGVRTIYVCPPFLTLNTLEEFQKWAPQLNTKILDNVDWVTPDVLIVPDSQLHNPYVRSYIRAYKPQMLIGDEWHRYKTETAQRSKAMIGYKDNRTKQKNFPGIMDGSFIQKVVLMSGTPMPNRPMELFTTFSKCAGQYINFMSRQTFGMKYCAGFPIKNDYNGKVYGYDFTGCNEEAFEELMLNVKSEVFVNDDKSITVEDGGFMLRLNKDILGLPKLTEEITILGEDMPRGLKAMNHDIMKMYPAKDLMKMQLMKLRDRNEEDLHIMTYRRLLGEHKVKPACDYIESILEETDENLLIVAYHKEVIRGIEARLSKYNPYVITGDTPTMKRQKIVKEFQASKNRRVILGNLDAIGVGFTITKVNRVPLVEFDWSDGKNRQVIDRAHRYGLKHPLLAEYLCFRNSIDRNIIAKLLEKQQLTAYV